MGDLDHPVRSRRPRRRRPRRAHRAVDADGLGLIARATSPRATRARRRRREPRSGRRRERDLPGAGLVSESPFVLCARQELLRGSVPGGHRSSPSLRRARCSPSQSRAMPSPRSRRPASRAHRPPASSSSSSSSRSPHSSSASSRSRRAPRGRAPLLAAGLADADPPRAVDRALGGPDGGPGSASAQPGGRLLSPRGEGLRGSPSSSPAPHC